MSDDVVLDAATLDRLRELNEEGEPDLTVMRIVDVAASYKVAIRWRPFLLGPIFRSLG